MYDVDRDQVLHVEASNLTFDCNDTYAGARGCGAPPPEPAEPVPPVQNAVLYLEQQNRRWNLSALEVNPDLSSTLDVQVPAALRAGNAMLLISDFTYGDYAQVTLVLA